MATQAAASLPWESFQSPNDAQLRAMIDLALKKKMINLNFTERNLHSVPPDISKLVQLETMSLAFNKLAELPSVISSLSNLKYISLKSNDFSEFPIVLCDISGLEIIDLSRNKLTNIPSKIGTLSNLKVLALSKNKIRMLPRTIGLLKSLEVLKIEQNPMEWPPPSLMTDTMAMNDPVQWLTSVKQFLLNDSSVLAPPPYIPPRNLAYYGSQSNMSSTTPEPVAVEHAQQTHTFSLSRTLSRKQKNPNQITLNSLDGVFQQCLALQQPDDVELLSDQYRVWAVTKETCLALTKYLMDSIQNPNIETLDLTATLPILQEVLQSLRQQHVPQQIEVMKSALLVALREIRAIMVSIAANPTYNQDMLARQIEFNLLMARIIRVMGWCITDTLGKRNLAYEEDAKRFGNSHAEVAKLVVNITSRLIEQLDKEQKDKLKELIRLLDELRRKCRSLASSFPLNQSLFVEIANLLTSIKSVTDSNSKTDINDSMRREISGLLALGGRIGV